METFSFTTAIAVVDHGIIKWPKPWVTRRLRKLKFHVYIYKGSRKRFIRKRLKKSINKHNISLKESTAKLTLHLYLDGIFYLQILLKQNKELVSDLKKSFKIFTMATTSDKAASLRINIILGLLSHWDGNEKALFVSAPK